MTGGAAMRTHGFIRFDEIATHEPAATSEEYWRLDLSIVIVATTCNRFGYGTKVRDTTALRRARPMQTSASMRTQTQLLLAIPITLAACTRPVPGARPHDQSMTGHREEAATHEAAADRGLVFTGSKAYYDSVYTEHRRIAAAHLRAAQQLEAEYTAACGGRARDSVGAWPEITAAEPVPSGVILHLAPTAGSHEHVLADLECHRAALARDGFAGFPDDPLAVEALDIVVHDEPGGTAVMLGVEDEAHAKELRRRADLLAPTP